MTCKDCYHYDVCTDYTTLKNSNFAQNFNGSDIICDHFKDKSRIVELPCKIGDNLYFPWVYSGTSGIAILEVISFRMYAQGKMLAFIKDPQSDMPIPNCFYEEEFGKIVFLTREEAEEALRERWEK